MSMIAVSLLLLMALCLLLSSLCMEYPRAPFWNLYCSHVLHSQLLSGVILIRCDFHTFAGDAEL